MSIDEIIELMSSGCDVRNHGRGWYIYYPKIGYGKRDSVKVEESIIKEMENRGIITVSIPYTSAKAELRFR